MGLLNQEGSSLIPQNANTYLASPADLNTQFEEDGKTYLVYAVQFYVI